MQPLHRRTIDLPWKLSVPSTSFVSGPDLKEGRTSILTWTYEGDSEFVKPPQEGIIREELIFEGVVAFKCTYNGICGAEIIRAAYNNLVDFGQTDWLTTLKRASEDHYFIVSESLKHTGIFFDEGPFYEFVCESVHLSTKVISTR
jgi:hypothetical protein